MRVTYLDAQTFRIMAERAYSILRHYTDINKSTLDAVFSEYSHILVLNKCVTYEQTREGLFLIVFRGYYFWMDLTTHNYSVLVNKGGLATELCTVADTTDFKIFFSTMIKIAMEMEKLESSILENTNKRKHGFARSFL